MTGQHTGHTRIRGNARYPLQPEDVTVAEVLKQAGYTTALIGKWGLGEAGSSGVPTKQGFDSFFGYLNQRHAHNYYPEFLWRNEEKSPLGNEVKRASPKPNDLGGVATKRVAYSHDLFVQEALEFIDRHTAGANNANNAPPFFLYLSLTIPHANNQAGKKGMEVPDLGRYRDKDWPEPQKGTAAMISRMDRDIGRIVARLKQRGIDRDTIVFFTSDNGPHREGGNDPDFFDSNGPLRGIKRDLYEGGIRVPAIVYWPGHIRAGSVSDQVGTFADFLPTAAALAGVAPPPPSNIDGVSLVPTLLGRRQDLTERFLYWEFHERGSKQAVRWRDWKAVRFYGGPPLELYNLATDVGERHNVAAEHPEIVKKIEDYLETARTPSEHWPLQKRRQRRRR